jgi:dCTP deaminase
LAVLGRDQILRLLADGLLRIEPFERSQVGPASIDLHLGNSFRVFEKSREIFHVREDADYKRITRTVRVENDGHLLVMPGELAEGVTRENITLNPALSARIEGRSRFARLGLLVHLSSGFMQPGSTGKVVLEILNVSPFPLALHPGIAICQIIIEEAKGAASYAGAFSGQIEP